MTRTWKCLLGAVAVCALLNHAAFAEVIESDDVGVVRVQPGNPNPVQSANTLYGEQEQVWLDDFQPPPGYGVDPVTVPRTGDVGYAVTSSVEDILYRIDRVNRNYHGFDGGWTGINTFVPMRTFNGGTSLLAVDARAFVSDYGQGGLNLGVVGRRYISSRNSVLGVSAWYDYDQAHRVDYSQLGLHASLVGPNWSMRSNVQVPVGQSHTRYGKQIVPSFNQDLLLLQVNSLQEVAYSQIDFEFATPVPYFGRYGMEFGLGWYYLNGAIHGVEDGHGISTRYEAQLTEDMWLNAFLTHDGVFGSNLSVNLQVTLPNGPPARFLRRLPPRQYLVASDKRPYRVLTDTRRHEALSPAVNPQTLEDIRVAHIDPNGGAAALGGGPLGTFNNPFPSIAAFEALPNSVQDDFEVILVRGRNDLTDTNLNTTVTLFDGQYLYGTGSQQFVNTTLGVAPLPNLPFSMPTISNSGAPGVDVVRLADMNTVGGLIINATGTANAINGQATVAENPFEAGDPGVRGFNIHDNIIRNAIVGVDINVEQSVTGEDIVGNFTNNIVELTSDDGLRITYDGVGAPSDTLDLTIRNNLFQGTLGQAIDIDLSGSAVATFDISDNELFLVQQNSFVTGLNFVGQQATLNDFLIPNIRNAVIAVSDEHIVELTENGYTVYDKATGAQIGTQTTLNDFWTDAGALLPIGTTITEPRILYDPTVGRWFAVSIDVGPALNSPFSNNIYVAVSNSADPEDGWSGFSFVADTRLGIELAEFATLGIDNDGLYIATNNFGGLSPFGLTVSVFTIPKADLLGPNPSIANLSRHEGLTATNAGYGDTLQPVVDFGTSDGGEIIGLGDSVTTFVRSTVTGADSASSTLSAPTEFVVGNYSFPGNPTTPAGFPLNSTTVLPVSSPIASSVVKVGNSIWAVQSITPPDPLTGFASAIQWYEIDATTNTLLQSGIIEDPNIGFLHPSIAVNQNNQVVIGMSGTGPNLLPSTFAVAGQTVNGVTTFGAPIVTSQGQAEYSLFAWGAYSATVLDPTARNSNVFWTVQERTTNQEDFWATQITQVIAGLGGNDGIVVRAHDTSTVLNGSTIDRNNIQGGTGSGIAVIADGGAFVDLSSTINDNSITGMGTNGMFFASDGGATLLIDGNRNNVSGNGGIGLFMQSFGASTLTVDLRNSQFDENGSRGIQAEAHDASNLTFSLTSPFDPFATGPSSASNNTLQGMNLKAFGSGNLVATIDDVIVDPNGDAGISVLLEDDSTGLVSITDSVIIDTIDGPDVDLFGEGIVLRTVENSTLTALVDNNLIDGHASNGMRSLADGTSTLDVTITNNRITNNNTDLLNNTGGVGLVFDRQGDSLLLGAVSGNIVTDNGSGGMIVRTTGGNNLLAGTVINADNNDFSDNGFNGGGDGVAITTAGSSVTLVNLTCNLIDGSATNGISVTANNQSFFGEPPLTPSVFDSNIVTNSGVNGILLNENNQAFLFLDIVSDAFAAGLCDDATLIANNAVDGIQLNTTGSGTTSVRVGNAANPFPDVTITQNLDDAIQIAMSGSGTVDFSVDNASLTGARVLGVAGDPGLNVTYTGTDDARIRVGQDMGADHVIDDMTDDRSGVDIYNFAGDGVFVDYNPTGVTGSLNMLFANSRIGLDGTRFNTGDGVEINARGTGFVAEFYGNTIRNNLGDGVRFVTLTDIFAARTIVVGPGGQNVDTNSPPNFIGDIPGPDSPALVFGTPFYVNPWGDRSLLAVTSTSTLIFGDPSQGARFAGNNISNNGDDGIELSMGAGTLLNATVRGNTLVGNTSADFRTSTATNANLLVPVSINRAEGMPDDVVLDPMAHLRLDFGDSSLIDENINIGNILLPTTTGGTISSTAADPIKMSTTRPILTDFRVVVPDQVFPPGDNEFTIFGVDQNEAQIFLNNFYNLFGGTIQ